MRRYLFDLTMFEGLWLIAPSAARALSHRFAQIEAMDASVVEALLAVDDDDEYDRVDDILSVSDDGLATIRVRGVLSKEPMLSRGLFGETVPTYGEIGEAAARAAADPRVNRALLHVTSPGGYENGLFDAGNAIYGLRQAKPTRAYVEDRGSSAAFWLASQTEEISLGPMARTGSMGVWAMLEDSSDRNRMRGLRYRVISTGGVKGLGADGVVSDALVADEQRLIDSAGDLFVEAVARGRGIDPGEARKLMTGAEYRGREAVELGYADHVEGLEEAVVRFRGKNTSVVVGGSDGYATGGSMSKRREEAVAGSDPAETNTDERSFSQRVREEVRKLFGAADEGAGQQETPVQSAELKALREKNAEIERQLEKLRVDRAQEQAAAAVEKRLAVLAEHVSPARLEAIKPHLIELQAEGRTEQVDSFLKALRPDGAGLFGGEIAGDEAEAGVALVGDKRTPEARAMDRKNGISDEDAVAVQMKHGGINYGAN